MAMNKQQGFSLIELMIAVAIVGILATIAYPAYQDQVRKGRRADAQAVLLQAAQWMERQYTESLRYDQDTAGAARALPTGLAKSPMDGTDSFYTISLSAVSATAFTLTATATGVQAADTCGDLTLTNTGLKGVSKSTVDNCW